MPAFVPPGEKIVVRNVVCGALLFEDILSIVAQTARVGVLRPLLWTQLALHPVNCERDELAGVKQFGSATSD